MSFRLPCHLTTTRFTAAARPWGKDCFIIDWMPFSVGSKVPITVSLQYERFCVRRNDCRAGEPNKFRGQECCGPPGAETSSSQQLSYSLPKWRALLWSSEPYDHFCFLCSAKGNASKIMELPVLHRFGSGDKAVAPPVVMNNVAGVGQSVWVEFSSFLASVCTGLSFRVCLVFHFTFFYKSLSLSNLVSVQILSLCLNFHSLSSCTSCWKVWTVSRTTLGGSGVSS